MNKKLMDVLMTFALINECEFEAGYIDDSKVNECIMNMYFYMLYNGIDNDVKKEEYFKEFEKSYQDLDKEQQEIVKKEYIEIIEAQSKNREKVKKKGNDKYE